MAHLNTSECSSETCNHIIGYYLEKINSDSALDTDEASYTSLCKCVYSMNECMTSANATNESLGLWLKNVYLAFYVTLILVALVVIFITLALILIDHRINPFSKLKKIVTNNFRLNDKKTKPDDFNDIKPKTELKAISTVSKNHVRKMNASSDFLILCLMLSYLLIILVVVPIQTYLFYFDAKILATNCKSTEFFKAFSVSFSIYCLVAVALQRLFAIKFSQTMVTNHVNAHLMYKISYDSFSSFFSSLYEFMRAFLVSVYYRNYLITTLLAIAKWIISFAIGFYNMSLYNVVTTSISDADNDLFFLQLKDDCRPYLASNLTQFPTECSRNEENSSDIFFVIVLLIMPNFLVFGSYSWICYYVYSNSLKFRKSCEAIKQKDKLKRVNSRKYPNLKEDFNLLPLAKTKSYNTSSILIPETKPKTSIYNDNCNFHPIQSHTTQVLNTNSQISINKRNKSVILTTCLMVICFTICWTPFFVLPMFYKMIDSNTYTNLKVIIHLLGYSSAIWNPIILIIKSKRFKLQKQKFKTGFDRFKTSCIRDKN